MSRDEQMWGGFLNQIATESTTIDICSNSTVSTAEIEEAIKRLKLEKASGPDEITAALWKWQNWYSTLWHSRFFN